MKSKLFILTAILIFAISLFAMSGDGGQQPTKPEKKTEAVQIQSGQEQLTESTSSTDQPDQKEAPKRATIAHLQGYVTKNVWPDQEKEVDVAKYQSMKNEYVKKVDKLGRKGYGEDFWEHRIDLDVYEKLKKDGEISERWEAEFRTPEEKILRSQIIVIGEVVSHEYDERKMARFKTSCKVKVDEVLHNKYFINEVPKELIVKIEGDLREGHWNSEPNLQIGKKFILYLNKVSIERLSRYSQEAKKYRSGGQIELLPLDIDQPVVFSNVYGASGDYEIFTKLHNVEDLKAKIRKIERLGVESEFFQKIYE